MVGEAVVLVPFQELALQPMVEELAASSHKRSSLALDFALSRSVPQHGKLSKNHNHPRTENPNNNNRAHLSIVGQDYSLFWR
jgi:hypothetical protein